MDQVQYEYKNVVGRFSDKDLNKFSVQGWELVSAKRRTLPFLNPPTDYIFRRSKGTESANPEVETKKKISLRPYAWIFGILFLVIGFVTIFTNPLQGILLFLSGIILFPPAVKFLENKFHKPFKRKHRIALAVLLLIICGITLPQPPSEVPVVANTPPQNTNVAPVTTTTQSTTTEETAQEKAQAAKNAAQLATWQSSPAGQMCLQHPSWTHTVCQAIVNKQVTLGMNEEQVVLILGQPTHTIVTKDSFIGKSDFWVYGSTGYTKNLYFVNDVLKSIQN